MVRVDFLIKTFLRPGCVRRLVESILTRYPQAHLSIADDGDPDSEMRAYYEGLRHEGHQVLLLPFNVGTSAGRNALIDATRRPYLLFLDDDFVFTKQTRVETLVDVLDADARFGVAGGSLLEDGTRLLSYEYRLRLEDGLLHYDPAAVTREIAGHACRDADIVLNFALFRRQVFDDVRWDDELKTVEHTDFFLRLAQTPWRVVHVRSVAADHRRETSAVYERYRNDPHSGERMKRKWGIEAAVWHSPQNAGEDGRRLRQAQLQAARRALRQRRVGRAARWLLRAAGGMVSKVPSTATTT